MEKTLITKVLFHLAWKILKVVVKRTDNKLDDNGVKVLEDIFNDRGL